MQYNQTSSIRAWIPFFTIALVTMLILFVIADVRLP